MTTEMTPGLLVLHGNRLELLKEAVFDWIGRQSLDPLEEDIFLVQSNGVAEWLKMALAEARGVCAATRVELPARFLWRCYRQALGRAAVPGRSPVDRTTLTWRLMQLLPERLGTPGFEPLTGFLGPGDLPRRLQLAERLADLFDQYQVYRADWLAWWAQGHDVVTRPLGGAPLPLPADQRWQPALWRDVLAQLGEQAPLTRDRIHQQFLDAMAQPERLVAGGGGLPRRVVVFGMAHLPLQTLEALAALARHAQIILAVPNPCRYHWGDIMDGRELLHVQRHRQPLRDAVSLAQTPLDELHAHAHPLLAAWGRQGRDFIRQLDAFDDAQAAAERFSLPRIDLFDDGPGQTLLEQVQAHIRDMRPLHEHPAPDLALPAPLSDRSIVFHVAHSAQREMEVLHDQLLALLATPPEGRPLRPRDIVVMVPDIDAIAPAIQAVFGQVPRQDPRHIPFEIADQQHRGHDPLLVALEWLLHLPDQRCTFAEVRDLLDVPAIQRRLGLDDQAIPRLSEWLCGAQVRWGLNGAQRIGLGLPACGEQNTWAFGLRRMLLGYANGHALDFAGIEPYGEVAGLEAALAGPLADLVDRLAHWSVALSEHAPPAAWGERLRRLLADFFKAGDERERLSLSLLDEALARWLDACETAGFLGDVPLGVAREAWLSGVDDSVLGKRFMAGGVTFCTLMPMRAVPFEVVCLLGLNEGDYPRQTVRNDFDLMTQPGMRRPGDRARRDDDRYLMLEALLSARRVLYISWTGRHVRDNSEMSPSVLVSQLRDYLAAGWGAGLVHRLTTEHPLQPFSRRYFEQPAAGQGPGSALFTFAREWQAAHRRPESTARPVSLPSEASGPAEPLSVRDLGSFLRHPVRLFVQRRLHVQLEDPRDLLDALEDDEPFALDGLGQYQAVDDILKGALSATDGPAGHEGARQALVASARRLARAGRLPMAALGERELARLVDETQALLVEWLRWQQGHCALPDKRHLRFEAAGVVVQDWLDALYVPADDPQGRPVRLSWQAGRVTEGKDKARKPRADKLLDAWVWALLASAAGHPVDVVLLGRDAVLRAFAPPADQACEQLADLMQAWRDALGTPLPVACMTAMAYLSRLPKDGADAARAWACAAYEGGIRAGGQRSRGDADEPHMARFYPDFEALTRDGRFEALAERLYGPLHAWLGTVEVSGLTAGEEGDGE